MAQVCPSCGSLVGAVSRFCGQCGRELGRPITQSSAHPSLDALIASNSGSVTADRRGISGRRLIAVLALIALMSAGAGVYMALPGHPLAVAGASSPGQRAAASPGITPSTPKSPAVTELSELQQITAVLGQSASARTTVEEAVNGAGSCQMQPTRAISIMEQAIAGRQDAIGRAEGLYAGAISNGALMLGDLLHALRESSAADQDFAGWIQDIANSGSCPVSTATDASYQAGYRESQRAVAAKDQFVMLWNPLAQEFGQPTFTSGGI